MMLDYDVDSFKIEKAKEAINYITSRLENMSKGEKQMYYLQKLSDLNLIANNKFSSNEDKVNFINKIINDMSEDLKNFEE